MKVLKLSASGVPQSWISLQEAVTHYAAGDVRWEAGTHVACFRGGHNAVSGLQSRIEVAPIIALRGASKLDLFAVTPHLNKPKLLRRDRHTCAYCGQVFGDADLQCEHIVPDSRGGAWSWMNIVAACASCNQRKAARTPEEAGMPLLFLPYVPSRYENFLLEGRRIRADVHAWLAARLPKGSRLS